MAWELERYRERAERFVGELDREYYLHLAGHKPQLELEAIYGRFGELFEREAVERIAALRKTAGGEAARRLRYLHQFAVEGYLGAATSTEEARLAELEATLQIELRGEAIPYRHGPVVQANEPDAARRAEIESARNAILAEWLSPIHRQVMERRHATCIDLGWPSYRDTFADLRGIDLGGLAGQMNEFADVTESPYRATVDPELERTTGRRLGELCRSDLARVFRAAHLDPLFPLDQLVDSFKATMAGLGIDLEAQENVHLDTASRPTKSPRAFCATPRVPGEVYLVVPPVGGREDFATLFHEGGHAEHYGCIREALPFEFRHLGDNSVTESFAFLLEGLTADPEWLRAVLGVDQANRAVAHGRAAKLILLRRYSAKIAYEVELHGPGTELDAMRDRYVELLSERVGVPWPGEPWLSDVDPGFYVACYLRAWALETSWRRALRDRFGERWFQEREAGEWLRGIWAEGQRLDAEELLAETLGGKLDFAVLAAELAGI